MQPSDGATPPAVSTRWMRATRSKAPGPPLLRVLSSSHGTAPARGASTRACTVPVTPLPASTALGSLARHLTASDPAHFQPANVNYGLFPPLGTRLPRRERRAAFAARAHADLAAWIAAHPGVAA